MSENIEAQVRKIVAKNLGVDDESKITRQSHFVNDLGMDSLDQVEMVMAFEEQFGVEISDDDAAKIQTVEDAISYIEKHKK